MASLVLTVIGDDRAGLVSAVAAIVDDHGGNWERSQMSELAGKFAGIVMVTVPDAGADDLIGALEPLHGLLEVTAQIGGPDDAPQGTTLYALELLGADRPGIVHDISQVLSDHGVSIGSLETETRDAPMAGGRLFAATAALDVPDATDLSVLQAALEDLANELMVDIDLDPAG